MSYDLFASGHTACAGCGQSLAMRLILEALGPKVIIAQATGCGEIFSSRYPQSAWGVPWIHSLFENTPAVASGIEAALKALNRDKEALVIAQGGDGGLGDIGFGALSGLFERGHNILVICYDNEAYMNTGIQRSGLTPYGAKTTTSQPGKYSWGNQTNKKDLPAIALAHRVNYIATATIAYHKDLEAKIKKSAAIAGPKFIQVLVPCPLGWGHDTAISVKISRLAVQSGLFPLYEIEEGKITKVMTFSKKIPVEEYLKPQSRFRHLFNSEEGKKEIEKIQMLADANIAKFNMLKSS